MLGDDGAGAFVVNAAIPNAVRVNNHHGPAPALVQTLDLRHEHRAAQVFFLNGALQGFQSSLAALPATRLVRANEYVCIDFLET